MAAWPERALRARARGSYFELAGPTPSRVYVRLISVRCKEGGLNMPPPIVSRIYQELSNGSIGFHQAQKIARVPFPFPYAQLLAIMRLYFILTVPLAVVCFTNDRCATSARARTWVARRARRAHGAAPPHPAHS